MKRTIKLTGLLLAATLLLLCAGCAQPQNNPDSPGSTGTIEVNFYLNDGTDQLYLTITGNVGDNVFMPGSIPQRSGYSFAGWYLDPAGTREYNADPQESMHVYAKWSAPLTVTFVCEGVDIPPVLVHAGSLLPRIEQPQRDGYVFEGWFADAGHTILWDFATDTIDSNMTLYGTWSNAEFAVTFSLGNGETITAVTKGPLLDEPETPIRDDYIFGGWYKDEALQNAWNFSRDTVTGDITLYAKWTEITTLTPTVPVIPQPPPPTTPTTPPPAPQPPPPAPTPAPTYTVTFNSNGGSTVPPYVNVQHNSTVARPPDPSRDGYTLDGWYSDSGLTQVWHFSTARVTGNITLYAKWNPVAIRHTVTFNSNGGSRVRPYENVRDNTLIDPPANPTRDGFVFNGWFRDSRLTRAWDFDNDRVRGDITLYAEWTRQTNHTVTFNSNGGSTVPPYVNVPHNTTITRPSDPSRSGYTFAGWFIDSNLTRSWNFSSDRVRDNITLFAMWTPTAADITVSFDTTGGMPLPLDRTLRAGGSINLPGEPVRAGFVFRGWFTAADGGTFAGNANDVYTPSASITLFAQWDVAPATLPEQIPMLR